MSGRFTKVAISLVLRVVLTCLIHPLKAHILFDAIMSDRS